MKILLVNDLGAPFGGAEIHMLALRAGLRARGHDARLFASRAEGEGGFEGDYACFGTTGRFRTLVRAANPAALLALRKVLAEFEPDVVHLRTLFSQLSPVILAALRRVPTLYQAAWHESVCPLGHKMLPDGSICRERVGTPCRKNGCLSPPAFGALMLQRQLWLLLRSSIDRTLANSAATAAPLVDDGVAPVEVLWNGVPERPRRPPLTDPPLVTYAGRLSAEKGVDVLLEAFGRVVHAVPSARLHILGSGPERPRIDATVAKNGLGERVQITPFLPSADLRRALEPGWVHAVPSRCLEGFGLAAAEAMMRGTAVVASRAGGLAEIVDDGETGFLVPPSDPAALAGALLRLLRDRPLAEQFGQSGRLRAQRDFAESSWIDALEAHYVDLCRH